jgi:hypothetical protein
MHAATANSHGHGRGARQEQVPREQADQQEAEGALPTARHVGHAGRRWAGDIRFMNANAEAATPAAAGPNPQVSAKKAGSMVTTASSEPKVAK